MSQYFEHLKPYAGLVSTWLYANWPALLAIAVFGGILAMVLDYLDEKEGQRMAEEIINNYKRRKGLDDDVVIIDAEFEEVT